jgi:type IX secretion system PorP/SprF family membrane protein
MKKLLVIIVLFSSFNVWAQDIHFSQFYNSPLTLNPALTGKMNGAYRVGALYRNQWFQTSSFGSPPFVTYSGFADAPIRFKKDALGLGLVVFQDNAGADAFKTLNALASVAYHKGMGKDGKHSLSLGVQLGVTQKKIDDGDIRTENQYVGTFHDPNRPTGENLKGSNTKFDMNVGLHWNSMIGKRSAIYAGGALFHVLSPEVNFTNVMPFNLPRRFTVNAGADLGIGEKFSILPTLIFLYQDKAKEINAGAAFTWYLGGYYRINSVQEPIAYTAFDFKGFRLGVSYDFALTELDGSNKPGSLELSLIFVGKAKPLPNPSSILFCPRF